LELRRRDFLCSTASGIMLAGNPWPRRPAVAAGGFEPAPDGARIAKLRIYPPIGVCRVGGSSEWFHAPEVPGLPPMPEGGDFKDAGRKIKKQVQRFRVYAFDKDGKVIGEITGDGARIGWTVHLANTKAAWYEVDNPWDNGEPAPDQASYRRNRAIVPDAERERMLVIDGGEVSIGGAGVNRDGADRRYAFEGRFWGVEKVRLGHLRTDLAGRLLVVPPDGLSHSPTRRGIGSISDNDGWCDDWSDGPVSATVTIGDRRFTAEPAWVACVGPNFVPEIPPVTTMYDVIADLNVRQGWAPEPPRPLSYAGYILPIFDRIALMQWIAAAGIRTASWLAPDVEFSDPRFLDGLADASSAAAAFREHVFSLFRDPRDTRHDPAMQLQAKLPYQLGDDADNYGSPLQWFQLPRRQYGFLESWSKGEFIDDRLLHERPPRSRIEDFPLEQQPALLTEAALAALSGGAFHPGVELPSHLRLAPMYSRFHDPDAEPFRLAARRRRRFVQDLGRVLTPGAVFKGRGGEPAPVGPQMAGDLTRWMGVPWQAEAFSCQQTLMRDHFPTAAWWPARYPTDVLTERSYEVLMDPGASTGRRRGAFGTRESWWRDVPGIGHETVPSREDGLVGLIALWENLGFVVRKPAPRDPSAPAGLPSDVFVEVGHTDRWDLGRAGAAGRGGAAD
jgi:hypothetical protein